MQKRYCDKCKKELPEYEGYGFIFKKNYKISFIQRDVISNEKEIYDQNEYCFECFINFMKIYDEYKRN